MAVSGSVIVAPSAGSIVSSWAVCACADAGIAIVASSSAPGRSRGHRMDLMMPRR
jgi:hypothetical protein